MEVEVHSFYAHFNTLFLIFKTSLPFLYTQLLMLPLSILPFNMISQISIANSSFTPLSQTVFLKVSMFDSDPFTKSPSQLMLLLLCIDDKSFPLYLDLFLISFFIFLPVFSCQICHRLHLGIHIYLWKPSCILLIMFLKMLVILPFPRIIFPNISSKGSGTKPLIKAVKLLFAQPLFFLCNRMTSFIFSTGLLR